jgi:hypothetical protein
MAMAAVAPLYAERLSSVSSNFYPDPLIKNTDKKCNTIVGVIRAAL